MKTLLYAIALALVSLSFSGHASARCPVEENYNTDFHSSCGEEEPSPPPANSGSVSETDYGSNSWAYVKTSWNDQSGGRYYGVSHSHSCSVGDACYKSAGCTGTCQTSWALTGGNCSGQVCNSLASVSI